MSVLVLQAKSGDSARESRLPLTCWFSRESMGRGEEKRKSLDAARRGGLGIPVRLHLG